MFTKRSRVAALVAFVLFWALFAAPSTVSLARDGTNPWRIVLTVSSIGAFMALTSLLAYAVATWVRRNREGP